MARYGYARVSTDDQDLALQRTALHQAGVEHLVEEQLSGSGERPRLSELLAKLKPGDELYVWKLDRLGRNFRHLYETVTDLEARGIKFVSLRDSIDTSTAMGRLFFIMLAAFAEFEREIIRERTMAGLAEVQSRGVILGPRMYGFEQGSNTPVEAEAQLVQELADRVLRGEPMRAIATSLNDAGTPTRRGSRWESTTIRRLLSHDRTAIIIGHDQYAQLLKKLKARSEQVGRPAQHLLSGFVFCSCGAIMYPSRHHGSMIYKCRKGQAKYPTACGRLNVVADPLEELVTEKVWGQWSIFDEITEDDTAEVNVQIADLEAKLADLAKQVRTGLSLEFALPLEAGWREDLAAARQLRDRGIQVVGYTQVPPSESADQIAETWRLWSVAERRDLLRALGVRVSISASTAHRTFDPGRVQVTFSD